MTIQKERYKSGKGRKAGHGPAMVNVRLRWLGPGKKSAAEARGALRAMVQSGGVVPEGWAFAAIEWFHPREGQAAPVASTDWTTGTIEDFEKFVPLLQHLLGGSGVTVGVVE